jgi:hypothetical protein
VTIISVYYYTPNPTPPQWTTEIATFTCDWAENHNILMIFKLFLVLFYVADGVYRLNDYRSKFYRYFIVTLKQDLL